MMMKRERPKTWWKERLSERAAKEALNQLTSRLVIELDREGAEDLLQILASSIERLRDEAAECEALLQGGEIRRQLALLDKLFDGVSAMITSNGWRRAPIDER